MLEFLSCMERPSGGHAHGAPATASMLMIKTIPGSSMSTANELQDYCRERVSCGRFRAESDWRRVPSGLESHFNNERDQQLCQTQGSERNGP